MRQPYSAEEEALLMSEYAKLGPKVLAERLGRNAKAICLKARKMGLHRGIAAGNTSRRRQWHFREWSYDLGYIVGVYLGDGNIYIKPEGGGCFRLSVIDRDFCETTQGKLHALVGVLGSIRPAASTCPTWNDKWIYTMCNRDFVIWLHDLFGGPGNKHLMVLPDAEANKGMLEGLVDSEGTVGQYSIEIRMKGDLTVLANICDQLGIKRGYRHTGVRKENWYKDPEFRGFAISIAEFTRLGLGTHILRKAINGMRYKAPAVPMYI